MSDFIPYSVIKQKRPAWTTPDFNPYGTSNSSIIVNPEEQNKSFKAFGIYALNNIKNYLNKLEQPQGLQEELLGGSGFSGIGGTIAKITKNYGGDLGKNTPNFYKDVPSESWLQENIDYAKSKKPNEFGVPYMGKVTARFNSPVMMKVEDLAKLTGQRGEQNNVRKKDLDWLKENMSKTGKLPIESGKEYAPYIEIGYNGIPYISEGNHRIMAAKELGWEYLPVDIRYFDGGETALKDKFINFSPENILLQYKK